VTRGAGKNPRTGGQGPAGRTHATDSMEARQTAFLAAFGECGNITAAAALVPVSRETVYAWRDEDEGFPARLADAQEEFADRLEHEARRRAIEGVKDYVVSAGRLVYIDDPGNPGRQIPLVRQVFSDTLLLAMLKAKRPAEYKDRAAHEITGRDGAPIAVDVVFALDLGDGEEAPAS
jgi:hypothetical protein